jgi:P-aminobenzoate N-oxygenase AurF
MNAPTDLAFLNTQRYAKCIDVSKRVRWDIERDVIRGRSFDIAHKFLPDGLSFADRIASLSEAERRLLSQIQGRTYANMFGLVERFIGAKMLEITRDHALGDQIAFEALIRFTDEELKHQELFRRIERLTSEQMPEGYRFVPQPNEVANFVLGKSTWAVLALTCHIEIFSQSHYRQSIAPDPDLSPLFKDVFLFHWKEESQHAILDELEWTREDGKITYDERDAAIDDLIALVSGIDSMLQQQAAADVEYFSRICGRAIDTGETSVIRDCVLGAYRWQYIVSGVKETRFNDRLLGMIDQRQAQRVSDALAPIMQAAGG